MKSFEVWATALVKKKQNYESSGDGKFEIFKPLDIYIKFRFKGTLVVNDFVLQ